MIPLKSEICGQKFLVSIELWFSVCVDCVSFRDVFSWQIYVSLEITACRRRTELTWDYLVCSSFQCLRISNFFNNTDINQIQAMALIGQCLRNNLDTNSAWILMGMFGFGSIDIRS